MREVTRQEYLHFINNQLSPRANIHSNMVDGMVEYVKNGVTIAAWGNDAFFIEDDIDTGRPVGNVLESPRTSGD